MTRSRIMKIKFFVFLLIFLLVQVVVCDATFRERRGSETRNSSGHSNKSLLNVSDTQVLPKQNASEKVKSHSNKALDIKKTVSVSGNLTSNPANPVQNTSEATEPGRSVSSLNTGALKRGFYVLIGLGALVVAYFVFRSFRVSNTRAQMIRKYGILAHRQDVEMRPLPLDEDDDDDTTVFDASNMPAHNALHSSS